MWGISTVNNTGPSVYILGKANVVFVDLNS